MNAPVKNDTLLPSKRHLKIFKSTTKDKLSESLSSTRFSYFIHSLIISFISAFMKTVCVTRGRVHTETRLDRLERGRVHRAEGAFTGRWTRAPGWRCRDSSPNPGCSVSVRSGCCNKMPRTAAYTHQASFSPSSGGWRCPAWRVRETLVQVRTEHAGTSGSSKALSTLLVPLDLVTKHRVKDKTEFQHSECAH